MADAALADVNELPPRVRAVIDGAADVYVVTPTLPGRLDWLAWELLEPDHILIALRSSEHANWQERGLIEHVRERFELPLTTFALDPEGHVSGVPGHDRASA